jgi:hypothetical protein
VLIAKGLVTRAEFDEAMKPTANLSGKLLKILNDQIQKQSRLGVEHCRYPIETEVGIFPENAVYIRGKNRVLLS